MTSPYRADPGSCNHGRVPVYRDEGVVLRTTPLAEADRIITVLTRRNGRVRAVAKGVRKTSSRFGSRLEPGTYVDLMLHSGRSLDTITQADIISPYGTTIALDYARHTAAAVMLETAERLTSEEREPALRLFLLLVGGLRTLAGGQRPAPLVLDAFLLRSLAVSGYGMALDDCARCGEPGQHLSLSVSGGGVVCPQCRPHGAASVSAGAVRLLADLLRGDWDGALLSDARARREAGGIVAAYLQWHLERGLRALPHLERA
ncbi:DNA repair protein RecO [Frankia sp. QA3]|uniref:DNA repair protein RecO n=1 Tax=Frankia sp. QA3 TaxID=710111 RepID=UPI000269C376|nr:DNA repair protein RecO [Frankia sp. QA3]EIV93337.1 DNA repair protein RecO [Frankia sp. QA3]